MAGNGRGCRVSPALNYCHAGWMKSAAGRSSPWVMLIARLIPVATRAVLRPVSWLGVQHRTSAVAAQVRPRALRASARAACV